MRPVAPRDGTASAVKGSTRFGKSETMGTAKSMMDNNRQKQRRNANDEFLGPPPPNSNLIQVSINPTMTSLFCSNNVDSSCHPR